jgi:hypothetical protein
LSEALGEDALDHVPGNIREPEVSALELIGQLGVVDAQRAQDRGMQIVDVDRIFHDVVAVIVGLALADAGRDAAAGEPHGEAARMMIAPVIVRGELALAIYRSAKLAAPDDQRVLQ